MLGLMDGGLEGMHVLCHGMEGNEFVVRAAGAPLAPDGTVILLRFFLHLGGISI